MQTTVSGPQARKQVRSSVRLFGQLKYMNSTLQCRVVDLSPEGIGLQLAENRELMIGMAVTFHSPELGHLVGTVSWYHKSGKVGLRLKHTSSTYAQVSSYFRFFHEEVVPVLKR